MQKGRKKYSEYIYSCIICLFVRGNLQKECLITHY